MRHLESWACLFFIIFCHSVSYSQEITTGIYSDAHFSDIHGQDFGGKWGYKPGTVQGFSPGKENETNSNPKSAGDSSLKKITITFRGGLNVSWNGLKKDFGKYSGSFGPSLGFTVDFPLGKRFSLISGVSFERKGYSMKDSSVMVYMYLNKGTPMYNVDTKVIADYAVIPLLVSFPIGKSRRIFFNTGPWLGLKLDARNTGIAYTGMRSESDYKLWKNVVNDDFERYIKNTDFGWVFSTGAALPLFNEYKVNLAIQYSAGFENVYDKTPVSHMHPLANYMIRNRTISFLIGFTIPSANHLNR
jgi:hypothetical protein